MPIAPLPALIKPKMPLGIANCPLGAKWHPLESHLFKYAPFCSYLSKLIFLSKMLLPQGTGPNQLGLPSTSVPLFTHLSRGLGDMFTPGGCPIIVYEGEEVR